MKGTIRTPWKILALLMGLMVISNCHYNVEEELYPSLECQTNNVSYSLNVLPILQNNCYSCHDQLSRNGNVVLEGYDNLKVHVNNGKLLGVIKHQDGFPAMPQGQPQLVACEIAKIEQWVIDGAEEN